MYTMYLICSPARRIGTPRGCCVAELTDVISLIYAYQPQHLNLTKKIYPSATVIPDLYLIAFVC